MKKRKLLLLVILILAIELLIFFMQFSGAMNTINARASDSATISLFIEGDMSPPSILLISPENGYNTADNRISFLFNVTEDSEIKNCSLIIQGVVVQTLTPITSGEITAFGGSFSDGSFEWSVNCTDFYNNRGNSSTRMFNVSSSSERASEGGGGGGGEMTSYYIKEKDYGDGDNRGLKLDNRIFFQVKEIQHKLTLIKIAQGYAVIEISSNPIIATIAINQTKLFDVNGDGIMDISVKLNSIDYANGIAYFDIKKVEMVQPEETKPQPIEKAGIFAIWLIGANCALIAAAFTTWALVEELMSGLKSRKLRRIISGNKRED